MWPKGQLDLSGGPIMGTCSRLEKTDAGQGEDLRVSDPRGGFAL